MDFTLQLQDMVEGPFKDLMLRISQGPLFNIVTPPPIQVGPQEVGDINLGSTFEASPDLGSAPDLGLGSTAGDLGSTNDLTSSPDLGSAPDLGLGSTGGGVKLPSISLPGA